MTPDEAIDRLYHLHPGTTPVEEGCPHERPHKPLLLLAAFDLIDQGLAAPDRIPWCQELRDRFSARFLLVRKHNDQNTPENPFFYLQTQGFWQAWIEDGSTRHKLQSTPLVNQFGKAFAASPEGTVELFSHEIRNSPLIRNLAEIANQSDDPEGWISLRDAIRQIEDFPFETISGHCAQFGQKSLSAPLTASGLFETRQAGSTPGYHGRTVFRPARRGSHGGMAPTTHQDHEPAAATVIDEPRP